MKTLIINLLLFALCSISASAQTTDDVYLKGMNSAIAQMDTVKTVSSIKKVRNQFDRISQKYSDQWLPLYYVAYGNLEMVFRNPKAADAQSLLADAKEKISRLEKMKGVNKSELSTLWGYYYNALIATDPATNGEKFYNDAMSNYKKAIELDANNPRPIFLLAVFEQNLPSFLQSGKDYCSELRRAEELYNKSRSQINEIRWGENFLVTLLEKCQ